MKFPLQKEVCFRVGDNAILHTQMETTEVNAALFTKEKANERANALSSSIVCVDKTQPREDRRDSKEFFRATKKLKSAFAKLGVGKKRLAISLFSLGFETAMQVAGEAMQSLPDLTVRASIASMVKERLEEKQKLRELAQVMRDSTMLPDLPTPEEYEQSMQLRRRGIMRMGGTAEEAEQYVAAFPPYEEAKFIIEGKRNWIETRKRFAMEQNNALIFAGIPKTKRAGALILAGYMTGADVIREQQARQKQVDSLAAMMFLRSR